VGHYNVLYAVEDPEGKIRHGSVPVSAGSTMVARTWVCIMLIRYCPSTRFEITGVEDLPSSSDVDKSEQMTRKTGTLPSFREVSPFSEGITPDIWG
jgi:hypothetical protein